MAILASLFSISAFGATSLTFRKFTIRSIMPIGYLFACYTEVRILFWEHPIYFLLCFPLILFHRRNSLLEYTL